MSKLIAKQRVSILNSEVGFSYNELFSNIGKASVQGVFGNWSDATTSLIDAVKSVSMITECGHVAWLLIQRSLSHAVAEMVNEQIQHFDGRKTISEKELAKLLAPLNKSQVEVGYDFFDNPGALSIIPKLRDTLAEWLERRGMIHARSVSTSNRLETYFVYALSDEWRRNKKSYECLRDELDTPFSRADKYEEAWRKYEASIRLQVERPMFDESFGLKQVYIPLRGWVVSERSEEIENNNFHKINPTLDLEEIRSVINIESELARWIEDADPVDSLRVISGGPGTGKSSISKMIASKIVSSGSRRVLFVPLHQINLHDDFATSINSFARSEQDLRLDDDILNPDRLYQKPLLLIFDGLDELSHQGSAGEESAREFLKGLDLLLERTNNSRMLIQAIITGREVVIQANEAYFRKPGQVISVLPYLIGDEHFDNPDDQENSHIYDDPDGLLADDQRHSWWCAYGKAIGVNYHSLPSRLNDIRLNDITAQPLLNYLVALRYSMSGQLRLRSEVASGRNINPVYRDLLKAVWKRGWENHKYAGTEAIKLEEFNRILEEVAISAWHGAVSGQGRTTTVAEVETHCEESHLRGLLDRFAHGAKKEGVTRLLTAFYFRRAGGWRDGGETFEFTHKNFGEYLTARRIVGALNDIHEEYKNHTNNPGRGWNEYIALTHWCRLCGPTTLDGYQYRFLKDEIHLVNADKVKGWQDTLGKMINFLLRKGIPIEKLELKSFRDMVEYARNAEEALLAAISACAFNTGSLSCVDWPEPTSLGDWINRLRPQRRGAESILALKCLNNLNMRNQNLECQDLFGANLSGSDLSGANLKSANLSKASLRNAKAYNTIFKYCNFRNATLIGATLSDASLKHAILFRANLSRAVLAGADLRESELSYANMTRADISDADWTGAKREHTKAEEVIGYFLEQR